jgi:conjugal transfer pilus assembly protein TraW
VNRFPFTLLALAICSCAAANGASLGVVGKTYEIEEPDLLEHIESELTAMQKDGRMLEQQEQFKRNAQKSVERPAGVHLPRASASRVYFYDPSITAEADVLDHLDRVIHPAGTVINPLEYVSLPTPLVFFDGDDKAQSNWVHELIKDEPQQFMALMINGPVIDRMTEWNLRLYFDQRGQYVRKFGIEALPAVVRQEGYLLRIDEVAIEATP